MTWVAITLFALWATYVAAYMVAAARAERLRKKRLAKIRRTVPRCAGSNPR